MREFIIIAGPQAAGKTTVISAINEQYQNIAPIFSAKKKLPFLFPLQESRQIIIHKNIILGGIFMTVKEEIEIVQCDFSRMDLVLSRTQNHIIYIDECNIFTIAHAAAHGLTQIEKYWQEYIIRLKKLKAKVIFLDVPVETSWRRRKRRYEQRLVCFPKRKHKTIMEANYDYLKKLRPQLLDIYHRLPLPKEIINGDLPEKTVIQAVSRVLANLSTSF